MKYYIAALLFVVGGVVGWKLKPVPVPVTQTKVEYRTVDRVVDRVIKKDGTVTERIVEKEKSHTNDIIKVAQSPVSRYSLGVGAVIDPRTMNTMNRDWQLTAGARLGDLPLFLETGITSKKDVLLGLRYEW